MLQAESGFLVEVSWATGLSLDEHGTRGGTRQLLSSLCPPEQGATSPEYRGEGGFAKAQSKCRCRDYVKCLAFTVPSIVLL